jgi:hypothetical protein
MNLAEIDSALEALPASPVTDHDLLERARLTELRNDVFLQDHVKRLASARARPPQPSWVPVRVPPSGGTVYYPADGGARDPYFATVEDGITVIRMEPGHARALIVSDPAFRAAQTADLINQVFPDTHRGPVS